MIGIVGGGISGLALGWFLERRGLDFRLLEAEDRPGGVIRTTRSGGRVLEHGPQRIRLSGALPGLVRDLGLEDALIRVPPDLPLLVVRDGTLRRVPTDLPGFLRSDLLTRRGRARALAEPLTRGARPGETVERLLTRKFGTEAYRVLLGPLFGGVFAQDPADMYVRHALAPLLRSLGASRSVLLALLARRAPSAAAPPVVSFREGLAELVHALHRRLGDRSLLGTRVVGLRPEPTGGWRLDLDSGGALAVETVVLTAAAPAAARLLEEVDRAAAARLGRLCYNPLAVVHLHSESPLEGLGYQVAFGEPLRTRGVTWNASALGRHGVHTAFLGGSRDPGATKLADRELGEIAAREFEEVTGHPAQVLGVSRTRVPAWDRSWTALDGLALPRGLHLLSSYTSRVGVPGRVDEAERLAGELAGAAAKPDSRPPGGG